MAPSATAQRLSANRQVSLCFSCHEHSRRAWSHRLECVLCRLAVRTAICLQARLAAGHSRVSVSGPMKTSTTAAQGSSIKATSAFPPAKPSAVKAATSAAASGSESIHRVLCSQSYGHVSLSSSHRAVSPCVLCSPTGSLTRPNPAGNSRPGSAAKPKPAFNLPAAALPALPPPDVLRRQVEHAKQLVAAAAAVPVATATATATATAATAATAATVSVSTGTATAATNPSHLPSSSSASRAPAKTTTVRMPKQGSPGQDHFLESTTSSSSIGAVSSGTPSFTAAHARLRASVGLPAALKRCKARANPLLDFIHRRGALSSPSGSPPTDKHASASTQARHAFLRHVQILNNPLGSEGLSGGRCACKCELR
jgi:hypothetical protein